MQVKREKEKEKERERGDNQKDQCMCVCVMYSECVPKDVCGVWCVCVCVCAYVSGVVVCTYVHLQNAFHVPHALGSRMGLFAWMGG